MKNELDIHRVGTTLSVRCSTASLPTKAPIYAPKYLRRYDHLNVHRWNKDQLLYRQLCRTIHLVTLPLMFNLPQPMWIFHRPKMHVMQVYIAVVHERSFVGKKYLIEQQGIVLDLWQSPFTEMHTIHKIIPMQSLVKANMVRIEFMSMYAKCEVRCFDLSRILVQFVAY